MRCVIEGNYSRSVHPFWQGVQSPESIETPHRDVKDKFPAHRKANPPALPPHRPTGDLERTQNPIRP
jgi:hypothetical protein